MQNNVYSDILWYGDVFYTFEQRYTQYRIRTTPQEDNSPPYRFWSWWVVLFRGSGPSGELSWWEIVLGIVVLVGNGWALFLSGGELSSWGVVLEPQNTCTCTFGKKWDHDIINSIICILSTVQEMFREKLRNLTISHLPYFQSDFHQIFTILFKFVIILFCSRCRPILQSDTSFGGKIAPALNLPATRWDYDFVLIRGRGSGLQLINDMVEILRIKFRKIVCRRSNFRRSKRRIITCWHKDSWI